MSDQTSLSSDSALEISPLEFRFSLKEKTTLKKSFSLKNSGSEPLTIKLYARPAPGLDNAAYGRLAEWLSFSEPTITLAAGEVKTVPFSITVPESPPPGGQYAFLYAEILSTPASAAPSGNAFSLTSRAAIRLYGISEASAVRSVSVSSPHATTFSFSPNLTADATVKNSGNIDFTAQSAFSVSTLFGKTLYSDSASTVLLPDAEKSLLSVWEEAPALGVYRLSYSLKALDTEVSLNRLVLISSPIFTVLLVFFFLLALFFGLNFPKRPTKSKKSH